MKQRTAMVRNKLVEFWEEQETLPEYARLMLLKLADDPDKMVQTEVMSAFYEHTDERFYPILRKKVEHPYYLVRGYALDAIVKYPQFTQQDVLGFMQKERHAFCKIIGYSALIRLGCPQYSKDLLKFLKHPNSSRRCQVVNTLFNLFDCGEGDLPLYYKTVAQRMAEETSAGVLLSMGEYLMEVEESCLLGRKRPPFERQSWGYPEHFWREFCLSATKEEAKNRLRYLKKVNQDEYPKGCLAEYEDLQFALQYFRKHSVADDIRELKSKGNLWKNIGGEKLSKIVDSL